jgi:hypothetical protein
MSTPAWREAVTDLIQIKAANKQLVEAADKARDFLRHAPLESGVCCCGNPIEDHGYDDGHSPVDELQYHASNLADELNTALEAARKQG